MTVIRLPHIQRHKGRDGKIRLYFRHPNLPRKPLPPQNDPAFLAAYQAALAQSEVVKEPPRIRSAGTFVRLSDEWRRSAAFLALRISTQKTYNNIIKRMQAERFADAQLTDFGAKHIRAILRPLANRPAMYNRWLSLLGILFRYALENEEISVDPTSGIRRVKERGEGSRTWSEEEIAQYEAFWPVGSRQRLTFALMLYTGQRRSDAVKMGPSDIRDGFLDVIQQKTGARLLIPIHPALADIIALEPAKVGSYLQNQAGKQASSNGLGNQFRVWADAAGVSGDLSGHGLRKAAARRLAEAGCTTHQIAAITGHKTLSEVERYTRAVDQKKLAEEAMKRMENVKRAKGVM
ncbi:hypothetical protein C0V97_09105 [Asaia sp. W19]|nr:hypothetical protein C0V97_09105 [Asaia sp. W19]